MAGTRLGGRKLACSGVILAGAVLLWLAPASRAQPARRYAYEDVLVTARQMYTFKVKGQTVNVLLGNFSLRLGARRFTGRDAVMWIKERPFGPRLLRDIELYIEGDAKVVEPDGSVLKDRSIFDVIHHQGALRVRVSLQQARQLSSFPLYQRAEAVRRRAAQPPARRQPPPLLKPPVGTRPAPTTRPGLPVMPGRRPVTFRADKFTSEEQVDPKNPKLKRRVTIAKGNVYLSQGSPDQDLFMEMRSGAAVIYTKAGKLPAPGKPERILGAYLCDDVVLRRGERTVHAEELFYDFVTGRAIVIAPVLRTIQEQRNIPVYIRAREALQLGAYQDRRKLRLRGYRWEFRDALVTTSDFHTPEWAFAAERATLEDTTIYDPYGVRLSERRWRTRLDNAVLKLGVVPVLWAPWIQGDAEEGHTALRRVQFGRHGRFGWGGESEWFLFRLLGVRRPEGFKGRLEADWYERGFLLGGRVKYRRPTYSGYALAYGLLDKEREDDFGTRRRNIAAREQRGRLLWRHKQFLPRNWELQLEGSYLCDPNFLEQFFPGEFWASKDQENLIYAKKQRDNWALTILGKFRVNDFLTQTEAFPDIAGYLIGQSLFQDVLTLHGEGRVGLVRYRPDHRLGIASSRTVTRADLRQEIDLPLALGPVKLLPFVTGRLTYWADTPRDGGLLRPWGQLGAKATMHIWRLYEDVESRLWDLHRIKHIITPYGAVFWSITSVDGPDRLYPFNPATELYVRRLGGATVGVRQLFQTKRGPANDRHVVDWLRLDVSASVFNDADTGLPADGRYLASRPEYSLPRNALNGELTWHVSDSTTLLGAANYDLDTDKLGRGSIGLTVSRDPRLRYYLGLRYIEALESSLGTVGLYYKISRKYSLSVFEQYDFNLEGGRNEATSATIVRKFSRLYAAITITYDRTYDEVSVVLSVWPEGIPELGIGGRRLSYLSAFRPAEE